jgi:glutaredoxin
MRCTCVVIVLTLLSRPGCHLCDDMKAVVTCVARASPLEISLEEVDISTDPDLESQYGLEVPVLLVNGKKVAKYRLREEELVRMLMSREGEAGGAGKTDG